MNARDLAALAALGAVGYHLSKGKGKKGDAEGAVDASPEKDSGYSSTADAKSDIRGGGFDNTREDIKRSDMDDFKDKSGSRKTDLRLPAGGGTGNRSVTSKPAVVKSEVEKEYGLGNEGRRTSSTGDKIAAINAKSGAASPSARQVDALRATSRKAAAEDTAKRRASGTLPQIQAPSTARKDDRPYVGSLKGSGEKSMMDKYRESDMAKGFQAARKELGDTPAIDAVMDAGKAGMLMAATRGKMPLKSYSQPLLGGPAGKPALGAPGTAALPAPARQLTGPSKTDLMTRDRANRATSREDAMMRENADRYGLNPNAPGYEEAASSLRERLGGRDFTLKKKGGVIKKMASGGMTSRSTSASSRGDGIAQRGKTKGRMR